MSIALKATLLTPPATPELVEKHLIASEAAIRPSLESLENHNGEGSTHKSINTSSAQLVNEASSTSSSTPSSETDIKDTNETADATRPWPILSKAERRAAPTCKTEAHTLTDFTNELKASIESITKFAETGASAEDLLTLAVQRFEQHLPRLAYWLQGHQSWPKGQLSYVDENGKMKSIYASIGQRLDTINLHARLLKLIFSLLSEHLLRAPNTADAQSHSLLPGDSNSSGKTSLQIAINTFDKNWDRPALKKDVGVLQKPDMIVNILLARCTLWLAQARAVLAGTTFGEQPLPARPCIKALITGDPCTTSLCPNVRRSRVQLAKKYLNEAWWNARWMFGQTYGLKGSKNRLQSTMIEPTKIYLDNQFWPLFEEVQAGVDGFGRGDEEGLLSYRERLVAPMHPCQGDKVPIGVMRQNRTIDGTVAYVYELRGQAKEISGAFDRSGEVTDLDT